MLLQVGNRGDVALAQRADGQRIQRERPSGQKNVDGGKLRQVEQRGGNAGGDCRLFVVGEHAAGNQVDCRDARRDFNAYKPRSLRCGRAHGGCAALQQRLKRGEGLVVQAGVGEQAADRRVGRARRRSDRKATRKSCSAFDRRRQERRGNWRRARAASRGRNRRGRREARRSRSAAAPSRRQAQACARRIYSCAFPPVVF